MPETITRDGAVLPVKLLTARKQHTCNDCPVPIEPGDRYELTAFPPHSVQEYDVDRWVTWRNHYPRHEGDRFLPGCVEAAAYREHQRREADAAEKPCKCLQSHANITPTHDGHCCFVPASQTCHPAEVAEWERQRDERRDRQEASHA